MKLVFPGGEHPQVLLGPGVNRVGSDPQAHVVLDRPGVLARHCELHVNDHGVMLQVPAGTPVRVNGRQVDGLISLRPGDNVNFDCVLARLATIDGGAQGRQQGGALPRPANDDPGATAVRQVLPKYVLRSLAGEAGRSYPVAKPVLVGRAPECDMCLRDSGLSRRHARLVPTNDGVQIEDLGSTNGTFLNGRQVQRGIAVPGDEIGFDALRFRLGKPGQVQEPSMSRQPTATTARPRRLWWWLAGLLAAAALAAAAATILR